MSFMQLLLVLRARIWTALTVFTLVVATAVVVSLALPKKYTATASVVIDVRSPDPIAGVVLPGLITSSYMATQVDILVSQKVAMRVVKALKLDQNEFARQEYVEETGGRGSIDLYLANLLRRYLEVRPSRDSNVLDISYTAVDPQFATVIANAFAQAYIDTNLELRVEPAKQYSAWFDSQVKTLRDNLETAQGRLSDYQRKNNIVATDERLDVENARLAELSSQLVALQTQTADSASRRRQARSEPRESLPEVLAHPLVQGLKSDVARQEAKVHEMSAQLGAKHPQLVRAEAELASLRAKLDSEIRKVVSGINTTSEMAQGREADVRRALEAQRAKVMGIKAQRDELAVLQREAESAQRAYEAVANRLTQTTLESQSSQTNIHLLNPAVEPNRHSRPRVLLNTAIGIVLGGLLGIGLALLREALDRRVRSMRDLDLALGVPTLGRIQRDTRRKPRTLTQRRRALPAGL